MCLAVNQTGSIDGIKMYIELIAINSKIGMAIVIIFFKLFLLSLLLYFFQNDKAMNQQRITILSLNRLEIFI